MSRLWLQWTLYDTAPDRVNDCVHCPHSGIKFASLSACTQTYEISMFGVLLLTHATHRHLILLAIDHTSLFEHKAWSDKTSCRCNIWSTLAKCQCLVIHDADETHLTKIHFPGAWFDSTAGFDQHYHDMSAAWCFQDSFGFLGSSTLHLLIIDWSWSLKAPVIKILPYSILCYCPDQDTMPKT